MSPSQPPLLRVTLERLNRESMSGSDSSASSEELWMNGCQQSWIYLVAIFSARDILRQLPHEAKMFTVVDKNWKEIMRTVAKYPLALPAIT